MPVILLERVPLPSLKLYITITVALTSCSFYYSFKSVSVPLKSNSTTNWSLKASDLPFTNFKINNSNVNLCEILTFMVQDPFCIWILLNCGYCCLFLAGKIIQKLVFGELRVSESQHLKDKLWNFVFYKFIFVFGVINVQYMDEVLLWCAWFNVLGSFHLLAQLCKDRFEYLSFSAANSPWSYMPLVTLLGLLMILSFGMLTISVFVGLKWGFSSFAFMGAECVLLIVCLLHTLLRYILHLYEVRGDMTGRIWEKRSSLAYYTELSLELTALIIELAHHLHMLLWSNIFLSMASLVICMHIRFLVEEIRRRVRKHRNYLWVLYHMEQSYPMASLEELSEISDNCAICWEKMEAARKLPCSHLFHNGCLQSWLEQDTSCPTCRMALSINNRDANMIFSVDHHHLRTRTNHIFHFDGSRYVSWLRSFSVEVINAPLEAIHTRLVRGNISQGSHYSQIDTMAMQVQQLFQDYPLAVIISDLQNTRSVELTVSNILDGRLTLPPENEPVNTEVSSSSISLSNWGAALPNHDIKKEISEHADKDCEAELFSESAAQRELNLNIRKEKLLKTARYRYLERHANQH